MLGMFYCCLLFKKPDQIFFIVETPVEEEVYIFKVIANALADLLLEGKGERKRLYILAHDNFCSNNEFIDKPVENLMSAFKSLNGILC